MVGKADVMVMGNLGFSEFIPSAAKRPNDKNSKEVDKKL
jgi:hypothetical protein